MKVMDLISDNYKTLFQPEMRTTKRIVEKEIGEIQREMEEIEKEFCFLSPDFDLKKRSNIISAITIAATVSHILTVIPDKFI